MSRKMIQRLCAEHYPFVPCSARRRGAEGRGGARRTWTPKLLQFPSWPGAAGAGCRFSPIVSKAVPINSGQASGAADATSSCGLAAGWPRARRQPAGREDLNKLEANPGRVARADPDPPRGSAGSARHGPGAMMGGRLVHQESHRWLFVAPFRGAYDPHLAVHCSSASLQCRVAASSRKS